MADETHSSIAVTVDAVTFSFFDEQLQVLLIKRRFPPFKQMWAIPGGFVELDETLEQAARRELSEETGILDVYIEQLRAFGAPGRDPRMRTVSVAHLAVVGPHVEPHPADDAAEARWFPVAHLPDLAFDHDKIIAVALRRLRILLESTDIAFRFLAEEVTLTEVQNVYEALLEQELDKRNFRRKLLRADILRETGHYRVGGGRPARLYRYIGDADWEQNNRRLFP